MIRESTRAGAGMALAWIQGAATGSKAHRAQNSALAKATRLPELGAAAEGCLYMSRDPCIVDAIRWSLAAADRSLK